MRRARVRYGHIYLGNKMIGIPRLNAPWFDSTAMRLRQVRGVDSVFNPVDEDRRMGFDPMDCLKGTAEEISGSGFDRRRALGADWGWISAYSDGMIVGPDWRTSNGTISEVACHQGLGLPVWSDSVFFEYAGSPLESELMNPRAQVTHFRRLLTEE